MSVEVSSSRTMTITDEKKGFLTLAHLKALVSLADAANYSDNALVVSPSATNGFTVISLREGS